MKSRPDIFEIKESGTLGKGVFATKLIKKGDQILQFTGPVISFEQTQLKSPETRSHPLQITKNTYIDLEAPGVFVNHSCSPNAKIYKDTFLVALKNIHVGEEIFYDYSTTMMDDDDWKLMCECKNKNCRKIVGDFRQMPPSIQKKYIKADLVQSFIK